MYEVVGMYQGCVEFVARRASQTWRSLVGWAPSVRNVSFGYKGTELPKSRRCRHFARREKKKRAARMGVEGGCKSKLIR